MNRVSIIVGASILFFGIGFNQVASQHKAIAITTPALENLPTGQYYYVQSEASVPERQRYVLLRKAGSTVIGIDARSRLHSCFRGFIKGDRIVDATRVFPPYQPDSRWDTQDELVDLSQYQTIEPDLTDEQSETLQTCIQFFWR